MKRSTRPILHPLALLSLLLSIATLILWIRSYIISENWTTSRTRGYQSQGDETLMLDILPVRGSLELHLTHVRIADRPAFDRNYNLVRKFPESRFGWYFVYARPRTTGPPEPSSSLEKIGFVWKHGASSFENSKYVWCIVSVPFWLLLLLTAALPAGTGLSMRKRKRRRERGLCAGCGYDLRASPERCPECGTPRVKS